MQNNRLEHTQSGEHCNFAKWLQKRKMGPSWLTLSSTSVRQKESIRSDVNARHGKKKQERAGERQSSIWNGAHYKLFIQLSPSTLYTSGHFKVFFNRLMRYYGHSPATFLWTLISKEVAILQESRWSIFYSCSSKATVLGTSLVNSFSSSRDHIVLYASCWLRSGLLAFHRIVNSDVQKPECSRTSGV